MYVYIHIFISVVQTLRPELEGKIELGCLRHMCRIILKGILEGGYESVYWIDLTQERSSYRPL
jgi:hypothetical protein